MNSILSITEVGIRQKSMLREVVFFNTASLLSYGSRFFLTHQHNVLRKSAFLNTNYKTCSFFSFFLTCIGNVSKFYAFLDTFVTRCPQNQKNRHDNRNYPKIKIIILILKTKVQTNECMENI